MPIRTSVESVCEVAQLLKVKFLKDCFVKVNQKEYAEIKAGKRSLQDSVNSASEESPFKTPSPVRSRSRSKSPTKQVRKLLTAHEMQCIMHWIKYEIRKIIYK